MKQRIIGFDLARAYAIFGMFIVNFNVVFGAYNDPSYTGKFLALFSGNSSTVFVMLAGMGLALHTNRNFYTPAEKSKLRLTVLKRAAFLFVAGLLLNTLWPADILHFYGCYMFLVAFLLFIKPIYFLWIAALCTAIFHVLVVLIPFETGWDFTKLQYLDFYTPQGFLRNTFYNGWNAIFPWLAYFVLGMYLGRLNWNEGRVQRRMFVIGLFLYLAISTSQWLAQQLKLSDQASAFMQADYLPPFLPFQLSTLGFGLMLISVFMYLGNRLEANSFVKNLAATGQMTLTHYVSHVTLGMVLFAVLVDRDFTDAMALLKPVKPVYILIFSTGYFVLSHQFSKMWSKKFKNGPLETLMRKIAA